MVQNKGRLNQVLLCKLLKEQIQDIALLMAPLKLHSLFLGNSSCLLQGMNLVKINSGILLYRVHHGDAGKRLAQIHLHAFISNGGGTKHLLSHKTVQLLGQVHHPVVIRIRLIQLHQGELRVVPGIQTLVAEYTPNFINPLKSAYNKPLQIKLQGYTKL